MREAPRLIDARDGLSALFRLLCDQGYTAIGPTVREGAIVYDSLDGVDDLPIGRTDEQDGGRYRLKDREDGAFFGFAVGPQSFKQFLHVPTQELWRAERDSAGALKVTAVETKPPKYAFIGIRACEIHAIAIQDRVLKDGPHRDAHYAARREDNLFIAVNCGQAGGTCFCVSMKTGPAATQDFDLALTELIDGSHLILVEAGSERGEALLAQLPGKDAEAEDIGRARQIVEHTASQMGRKMDSGTVHDLLARNLDHARWDEVAERCLSCGNCTQVCPTCFCTTTVDTSDLTGDQASRSRHWDSCFTLDFSYLHGGSVRHSTKSRYRQWMTHKLSTWIDQFGTSGCVGCGRCITWCPVGIDITEEVQAIRESEDKR